MKRALLILAQGAEEMEAVVTIDILRRGGVDVTVAGLVGRGAVECSRKVIVTPDSSLEEAVSSSPYDAIILPGGLKGAESLSQSSAVGDLLKQHEAAGSIVAAICAAPIALEAHKIALGKRITSYPSVRGKLEGSYQYLEDRVVIDGNVTTSRGPGTAVEFALALVEQLSGKDVAKTVAEQMLVK